MAAADESFFRDVARAVNLDLIEIRSALRPRRMLLQE
jgi:hypothetical protein